MTPMLTRRTFVKKASFAARAAAVAKNHGWDTLIMGIRDTAKVKAILNIPEKEILTSVIAVGKSAQPYFKNPRKPVTEVLKMV